MRFNVLTHKLVPEHHLLSDEEAQAVLGELRVTKDQLPKVRRDDPVIRVLERIHGPIEEGRVVRVVRLSETAGVAEAYRVVVDR